ncbi:unnamed protein product [Caenorhabditis angaria]|uniref:ABC transporter domain-containing protein n=1 Tax=Caenorhabditis angaria TaxID=860376 RepID=A0A9P1ICL2_9PELO|nr:unnamed protein product [Caenorhabditis angaria]
MVEPEKHYLECKDISYMTAIAQGGSCFTAKSGEVHAVVGVTESGKTTLFESLSSGVGGDIGGIAMLDKFMLTKRRFNKYCAYSNYRVTFPSTLSIRSLLYYHARLYLSSILTSLEIDHRLNELMGIFDILGYSEERLKDLTVSAKKRVLTVIELLKDPVLILLDDPISDLTPLSSYQLIYALQYYAAKYNRIVIISLRNIRSDLYHLIGSATFLFYGQVAYSGLMNNLVAHFSKAGYDCPKNENPAAYYLALLTVDKETMESVMETHEIATNLISFYEEQSKETETTATNTFLENLRKNTRFPVIFRILISRFLAILLSSPRLTLSLLICLPIFGFILSFISLPQSYFFWKNISFIYLVLQFISLLPIYSEMRNLSFLEITCYSQSLHTVQNIIAICCLLFTSIFFRRLFLQVF